ncbi:F16 protein [Hirschfeldia incana]|nr:F16 protein [Hirschfeldia incana]
MFSLHDGTLCPEKRDQMKVYGESFHGSFKRIKQEDQTQAKLEKNTTLSKSENAKLIRPDVYLDTKVHSETSEYHRACLDLELNLCSSSSSVVKTTMKKEESSKGKTLIMSPSKKRKSGDSRSPSWLAFECDNDTDEQKEQEMVTTVCMKCHMLVMLCKSTLVCPSCKFTHTADHRPLSLFKHLR